MKGILKNGYWCVDSNDSRKEKADAARSETVTAELIRLGFEPVRRLVLKELQKHIRSDPTEMEPVEQISNKEFAPPDLRIFIK